LDGLLLIDKEAGETSFDVVFKVRKQLSLKKAGHAGTLDPFATGLLIVLLNQSARLMEIFHLLPKEYEAVFVFGEKKLSDDITGETVLSGARIPTLDEIKRQIPSFTGRISQIPSDYSALKIKGVRAYHLARSGQKVNLEPREITIFHYEIIDYTPPFLKVKIKCSTGTYIRALARDLAENMGTAAYVKELKRTSIGDFSIDRAYKTSQISPEKILSPDHAVDFIPCLTVKDDKIEPMRHGIPFNSSFLADPLSYTDDFYVLKSIKGEFLGILKNKKYFFVRSTAAQT